MQRQIIKIDQKLCNGCGQCVRGCAEGALQLIDGKAQLVSEIFCDGLGACIGECPEGAISIEKREAQPYDESKVIQKMLLGGENLIAAHLKHLYEHNQQEYLQQAIAFLKDKNIPIPDYAPKKVSAVVCSCPSTMARDLRSSNAQKPGAEEVGKTVFLNNWPLQLKLINPQAPYLKGADLLIAADCCAFSYPNFSQKFLKDKILIIFCPKLDENLDQYVEKLRLIFTLHEIRSITIARMEVPCCGGVEQIVKTALTLAGKDIPISSYTLTIAGGMAA